MRKEQRKLVSFDWAMKRILRQKANYAVLEGFLSELFREDITIINFEDSETNQTDAYDKYNRYDMLVRNSQNELILVEIQYDSEIDYFQRMLYGSSKLVTEYLNSGDKYEDVKKIYSVNLLYFDLGQGKDYVYHGTTSFMGLHFQDTLQLSEKQQNHFKSMTPRDIFPEYYILRLNTFDDYAKDNLDEWIYTLKNGDLPKDYRAKGLKEAEEILNVMNMDKEQRLAYDRFEENKHLQASMIDSSIMRAERAEAHAAQAEAHAAQAEAHALQAEENAAEAEAKAAEAEAHAQQAEENATRIKQESEDKIKSLKELLRSTGLSEEEIAEKLTR